jgi:hypothetical protein
MARDELETLLERLPPHHLFTEIPPALRDWLLPIDWDRDRLWSLDLPRQRVSLDKLRWHLDLPCWRRDGTWFQVTPREFLSCPDVYPEHVARIARCDLSFALHVIRRHHRWLILDGIHRLVKAELRGMPSVEVSPLSTRHVATIARREPRSHGA